MGTLKFIQNSIARTPDEAFEMIKTRKGGVVLVDSSTERLDEKVNGLYRLIREYNKSVGCIDNQILPTYSYRWNDIDGCLAVSCAEISGGTFAENADKLALFTGFNYSVLTDTEARKPLCSKAIASMAMLGSLASGR